MSEKQREKQVVIPWKELDAWIEEIDFESEEIKQKKAA